MHAPKFQFSRQRVILLPLVTEAGSCSVYILVRRNCTTDTQDNILVRADLILEADTGLALERCDAASYSHFTYVEIQIDRSKSHRHRDTRISSVRDLV